VPGTTQERYGAGVDTNIVTASVKALISAVNRISQVTEIEATQAVRNSA
jgi:hypothetical protein